jgi:sugar phosphate isomerase/epimerase
VVGACDWALATRSTSEAVELIASCGGEAIELTVPYGKLEPAATSALAATGVKVTALLPGVRRDRDYADPKPDRRQAASSHLTETLHLAAELSVPIVVVVPSDDPLGQETRETAMRRAAETIDEALAVAPVGPRVAIEPLNRYETHLVRTLEEGAFLMSLLADPSRACLLGDVFHMNIEEDSITEALRAHAPRVGHVHLADNQRRRPGSGAIDFGVLLSVLSEVEYAGGLGLECLPLGREELRAAFSYLADAASEIER